MRTGACRSRNATTSANVYLPRLRSGSAIRNMHDRPADQQADRVDQAVEAGERDEAGDAEKAGGAHVVAGEREAVLEAGDAAGPPA